MGFFLTKLMTVFGDREHKVIIVGLDNAGKTTILYQFLTKEAVHTSPTVGSNVEQITVRNTHFLVWDIGGQTSLRTSWYSYYCNTEDLQNAAILILANKQDVKGSMTAGEISRCLTLDAITTHNWHVQACCGLTGEGLTACLDWMRSQVVVN
ncbi:putative ADP-ribosylation factor-like protein 5C isoform X2 [Dunckerocampus dactyliophorus]|uniref:putative ADP-ribosylation factor-like protein 5C isoform X2 n=1 Tax=Dunckerocampus dactyliophorus TaxID=161453 RepID=UPI00240548C7|nr:putative ADP-ribosylation factor-like protein 5C isoform X2 [Dunckerocampus dactyliophorus]